LWPGVVIALLSLAARFVLPVVVPESGPMGLLGAAAGSLAILVWWVFFSRASRAERWGGPAVAILALIGVRPLLHPSIAGAGMGYLYPILAVPLLALALVGWAVLVRRRSHRPRLGSLIATLVLAAGLWTLLRTGGISNLGESDFAWRWSATPEERLLAASGGESMRGSAGRLVAEAEAEWPGFRGPRRDSVVTGVRIGTDWATSPPVEVWRRAVGPGWSSFAVRGDLFLTQEQRGESEAVSAYRVSTGEPVWRHEDGTRFWEANAGAGPRATPTLAGDRVYAFGATGRLNALRLADGSSIWTRDVATDTGIEPPMWGFSSSPLVVDGVVVVAAVGKLAAYDAGSGAPRWYGPDGGDGYSSPQLVVVDGVPQLLLMSLAGAVGVSPGDGTLLWEYDWPGSTRIVQPGRTADGDLLFSRGVSTGMRRVRLARGGEGWRIEERWTSTGLKPYYSDFVVHEGHAYGFDGNLLAAIDVETGERVWKGGRYGGGQLVLLPEQDLLLVVSERGELALVRAVPGAFEEVARIAALEGKTWNHPVVVGDLLLVRNSEEMAAFRLPAAGG
jgi:outer membrane protein assembly factor BamB